METIDHFPSLYNTPPSLSNHSHSFPMQQIIQDKQPKLSSIQRCELTLQEKLDHLKTLGILDYSLKPKSDSSDFEILEWYGDSVLYARIAEILMQTRRFMDPHLLTKLRISAVANTNLAHVYDRLHITTLLSPANQPTKQKDQADIIEAMIGEMSEALHKLEFSASHPTIKKVMSEIFSFISYLGELTYFQQEQERQMQSIILPLPLAMASTTSTTSKAGITLPLLPLLPLDLPVALPNPSQTSSSSKQKQTISPSKQRSSSPKKQDGNPPPPSPVKRNQSPPTRVPPNNNNITKNNNSSNIQNKNNNNNNNNKNSNNNSERSFGQVTILKKPQSPTNSPPPSPPSTITASPTLPPTPIPSTMLWEELVFWSKQ